MAGVETLVTFAGIGTSYMGGKKAARAEERKAIRNAAFNMYQADIVDINAKEQEDRYRRMVRRQMGAARAAAGGSGIQMTGSALEVMGDNAAEAELQALTIRHDAKMEAASLRKRAALGLEAASATAGAMRLSSVGQSLIGVADTLSQF
jgi:hypothetical protein